MKTFAELEYKWPDGEALLLEIKNTAKKLCECTDYGQFKTVFLELSKKRESYNTMENLAQIRNSIDTSDIYYRKEMEYFFENTPKLDVEMRKVNLALLESAYVKELEKDFGTFYLKRLRNQNRLRDERNVGNLAQENMLVQEYFQVSASPSVEFEGEKTGFSGLLKYMQSTDRTVRKKAFEAWAKLYESIAEKLDEIYTDLIRLRLDMADKLGFSDYTQMAYLQLERLSYGPDETAAFRKQVREAVVPFCQKLFEAQKNRLGVEKLSYYDEALIYPDGNAVPAGDERALLKQAGEIYRKLSDETGEFFDFMLRYNLFDLEAKAKKEQGGYCGILPEYKAPFIFANFNGTGADVFVLTHEAGHAFEAYTASRQENILPGQIFSTAEVNEIHSMSMELFTYPYMELLFGERADRYRREHLISVIQAVPYMVCVDEFQHRVYDEKLLDAEERRRVWKELEEIYLPWRDYDGNEFLGQGGFWMQKQHIFMCPFYYIDYALAQFGALEYYVRMKTEPENAWEDYYRLCCAGGTEEYFELLKKGGLSNPFEKGTIERIMNELGKELLPGNK